MVAAYQSGQHQGRINNPLSVDVRAMHEPADQPGPLCEVCFAGPIGPSQGRAEGPSLTLAV
jgi:hypothetical protein